MKPAYVKPSLRQVPVIIFSSSPPNRSTWSRSETPRAEEAASMRPLPDAQDGEREAVAVPDAVEDKPRSTYTSEVAQDSGGKASHSEEVESDILSSLLSTPRLNFNYQSLPPHVMAIRQQPDPAIASKRRVTATALPQMALSVAQSEQGKDHSMQVGDAPSRDQQQPAEEAARQHPAHRLFSSTPDLAVYRPRASEMLSELMTARGGVSKARPSISHNDDNDLVGLGVSQGAPTPSPSSCRAHTRFVTPPPEHTYEDPSPQRSVVQQTPDAACLVLPEPDRGLRADDVLGAIIRLD
jgi:hypothetical protein